RISGTATAMKGKFYGNTRASDACGCAGILRDLFPMQNVIEMMLHMQDVVLNDEAQGDRRCRTNHAWCGQAVLGDALDRLYQRSIVLPPGVDERRPLPIVV